MAIRRGAKNSNDTLKYFLIGAAALVVLFLVFNIAPTGKFTDVDATCTDTEGELLSYSTAATCVLTWTDAVPEVLATCTDTAGVLKLDYSTAATCVLTWTDAVPEVPEVPATCTDSDVTDVTDEYGSDSLCTLIWTDPTSTDTCEDFLGADVIEFYSDVDDDLPDCVLTWDTVASICTDSDDSDVTSTYGSEAECDLISGISVTMQQCEDSTGADVIEFYSDVDDDLPDCVLTWEDTVITVPEEPATCEDTAGVLLSYSTAATCVLTWTGTVPEVPETCTDTEGELLDYSTATTCVLTWTDADQVIQDEDADGVDLSIDLCADTNSASDYNSEDLVNVDATGCTPSQLDTDLDGVSDDADSCADTNSVSDYDSEDLVNVDENGCTPSQLDANADSDEDGVINGDDLCPATPAETEVSGDGCPDTDGDGIYDNLDFAWDLTQSGLTTDSEEVEVESYALENNGIFSMNLQSSTGLSASCSDGTSTDQTTCESATYTWTGAIEESCSDGDSANQLSCEAEESCSDGDSADQDTCEDAEETWIAETWTPASEAVCSDETSTDQDTCEAASVNTWSEASDILNNLQSATALVKVEYYDLETNEILSSTLYTSQVSIEESASQTFSISVPASETAVGYIATVNIWSGMIGTADWQPYSEKIELRGEFHP